MHGNKASLSLTYSGVHDISVKRVYFCIRPMPRNRLFFFFFHFVLISQHSLKDHCVDNQLY